MPDSDRGSDKVLHHINYFFLMKKWTKSIIAFSWNNCQLRSSNNLLEFEGFIPEKELKRLFSFIIPTILCMERGDKLSCAILIYQVISRALSLKMF